MKYLLYVTKAKPYCMVGLNGNKTYLDKGGKNSVYSRDFNYIGNGKIIAEFEGECEEIFKSSDSCHFTNMLSGQALLNFSKLTDEELENYLGFEETEIKKVGYAIHIKNLKVFDKPLELKEVKHIKKPSCNSCPFQYSVDCYYHKEVDCECEIPLTKAPQNMCWVWYKGEKYCLISIRPKWACKILNGEKTIEVRKKVLKECL